MKKTKDYFYCNVCNKNTPCSVENFGIKCEEEIKFLKNETKK